MVLDTIGTFGTLDNMKRKRLSMRLLWRMNTEYRSMVTWETTAKINGFLDYVESHIRTFSERHQTPTTTKRKSLTK